MTAKRDYMEKAIGLIETKGLVAMIEAADQMLKAAEVHLIGRERIGGGAAAAKRVGDLFAAHVIPRPHEELEKVLRQ